MRMFDAIQKGAPTSSHWSYFTTFLFQMHCCKLGASMAFARWSTYQLTKCWSPGTRKSTRIFFGELFHRCIAIGFMSISPLTRKTEASAECKSLLNRQSGLNISSSLAPTYGRTPYKVESSVKWHRIVKTRQLFCWLSNSSIVTKMRQ